uniref:RGS domain-containing protein n=1 Tax=Rhabditophanes sp. KR3021 TaxID=114890 RepID=A0AC35TJS5_9BILA
MFNYPSTIEKTRDLSSDFSQSHRSIDDIEVFGKSRCNLEDDSFSTSSSEMLDSEVSSLPTNIMDSCSAFSTSDSELYKNDSSVDFGYNKVNKSHRKSPRQHALYNRRKIKRSHSSSDFGSENASSSFGMDDNRLNVLLKRGYRSPPRVRRTRNSLLSVIDETSPNRNENKYGPNIFTASQKFKNKNWNPLQTSTTTNLHTIKTFPKIAMGTKGIPHSHQSSGRRFIDIQTSPAKRFVGRKCGTKVKAFQPEEFGVPSSYAKIKNMDGILVLSMTTLANKINVYVHQAIYFGKPCQVQLSSFVNIELETSDKNTGNSKIKRTASVAYDNNPKFEKRLSLKLPSGEKFPFKGYYLRVTANQETDGSKQHMIGTMRFRLSKLLEDLSGPRRDDIEYTLKNNESFFLIKHSEDRNRHFAVNKVRMQKFYGGIGDSACSSSIGTSSVRSRSPIKMSESECRFSQHQYNMPNYHSAPTNTISTFRPDNGSIVKPVVVVSNNKLFGKKSMDELASSEYGRKVKPLMLHPISSLGLGKREELLITENDYRSHHRYTMPSIDPSNDSIIEGSHDMSALGVQPMEHLELKYLYNEHGPSNAFSTSPYLSPPPNPVLTLDEPEEVQPSSSSSSSSSLDQNQQHGAVRRVASFTFSPRDKKNPHPSLMSKASGSNHTDSRKRFGLVSKGLSYIKHKMDALSSTNLFPSKDEIRSWEESFDTLLHHKYGSELFRIFLKGEFSDENFDFWNECEEFKKLKEGKKSTSKANCIFEMFVKEGAPREVNLDADTRNATKNSLEIGGKMDIFNLAQNRIEQLMAKDSYRRFLQSRNYLDLLQEAENTPEFSSIKRNSTGDM